MIDLSHDLVVEDQEKKPVIKHLVFSGGVIYGYAFYGAYKFLEQKGLVNIDNIQTMYGTSCGAMVAVILSLRFDYETLENYLIKRPWHEVFKFTIETFMNCYQKCGLFGPEIFETLFDPLFRAKDLDIATITMKEFYETTKIEHHFFTVDIGGFELIDISYKTHPDCRVLDAVYASSCVPLLFQPIQLHIGKEIMEDISGCGNSVEGVKPSNLKTQPSLVCSKKNTRLIDGGFLMNYPIQPCIQSILEKDVSGTDHGAILGMNLAFDHDIYDKLECKSLNVLEYLYLILGILLHKIHKLIVSLYTNPNTHTSVKIYDIQIPPNKNPCNEMFHFVNSQEERIKMIEYGASVASTQWSDRLKAINN
jgi:predicted acylesterase/phospholipase RssA